MVSLSQFQDARIEVFSGGNAFPNRCSALVQTELFSAIKIDNEQFIVYNAGNDSFLTAEGRRFFVHKGSLSYRSFFVNV